ncbi:hypothetical protein M422DRAFT_255467 [Sphaerobolus stellatus SS14]|uniref:Major facilitator superfamily (MFS) profile domain-containing protein n=1 Tax=Sphaerobolus stellatus (strain SS14) TaxID=990650 RepID=A0A0C9VSV3_SPHS4|nr:hypothetical protein M422DRAFT_255467 [Sphaerobolus stellatus SS14]
MDIYALSKIDSIAAYVYPTFANDNLISAHGNMMNATPLKGEFTAGNSRCALMGAALTIPSAQHLIMHMFPVPQEQAKAITIFGAMGGIGIVLGLVIGALFVTFTSWPWVFYFSSIVSATIVFSIAFLVPNEMEPD